MTTSRLLCSQQILTYTMIIFFILWFNDGKILEKRVRSNPHQRRLLHSTKTHIDCDNFDNLEPYLQYLCINETVDYFDLQFETNDFQCLSEHDIMTALSSLTSGWTETEIKYLQHIGTNIELVIDGGSIISFASWIIMKEIFNFNITLKHFYEDAMDIVQYFYPSHVIMQLVPTDIIDDANSYTLLLNDEVFVALNGIHYIKYWALQHDVEHEMYDELDLLHLNDSEAKEHHDHTSYLEYWQTYKSDEIIDVMLHRTFKNNEIALGKGDVYDGYIIPCSFNESCINNTWYPSVCNNNYTDCGTLIQWLPHYNHFKDRNIIEENELKLKITYIGGEWTNGSQRFLADRLQNKSRILYAIWEPSIWSVSDEFILMNYPIHSGLANGENPYKLIPIKFKSISRFGYNFLQSVLMTNDQYNWINKRMYDIDGVFETPQQRLNQTCEWIKNEIYKQGTNAWLQWIPEDLSGYMYDCDDYKDNQLEELLNVMDNTLDKYGRTDYDFIGHHYIDEATAYRIIDNCLFDGDTNPMILDIVKVIASTAAIIQSLYILIVLIYRQKVIIVSSAWKVLMTSMIGGYFGICYVLLWDSTDAIVCFFRPIFSQSALIFMLGALTGKTWRLKKISKEASKFRTVIISDMNIGCRVFVLWSLIILSIMSIQMFFPSQSITIVYDQCMYNIWYIDDIFRIFITCLYGFELLLFFYVGFLAWKLRNVNEKYNEALYIAIILYVTSLLIMVIISYNYLNDLHSPYHIFSIEALIWIIIVMLDTSVLILPKIYHIIKRTEFESGLKANASTECSNMAEYTNSNQIVTIPSPTKSNYPYSGSSSVKSSVPTELTVATSEERETLNFKQSPVNTIPILRTE